MAKAPVAAPTFTEAQNDLAAIREKLTPWLDDLSRAEAALLAARTAEQEIATWTQHLGVMKADAAALEKTSGELRAANAKLTAEFDERSAYVKGEIRKLDAALSGAAKEAEASIAEAKKNAAGEVSGIGKATSAKRAEAEAGLAELEKKHAARMRELESEAIVAQSKLDSITKAIDDLRKRL